MIFFVVALIAFNGAFVFAEDMQAQDQKDIEELQPPEITFDPSRLPTQMQWATPYLQNPQIQARARSIFTLMHDAKMQSNVQSIVKNPSKKWMYVGFALVTIVYLLVRARVLAATDRWYMRFLIRLLMMPIFLGGLLLVAYGILGQPIVELSFAIFKIMRGV